MFDLEQLRELASTATPGPWQHHVLTRDQLYEAQEDGDFDWWLNDSIEDFPSSWQRHGAPAEVSRLILHEDGTRGTTGLPGSVETSAANAAFIAAANPETVSALVEAVQAAQALIEVQDDLNKAVKAEGTDELLVVAERLQASRDLLREKLAPFETGGRDG